ncbi:MAG: DUF1573 domain-containing protein [Bacteroidia bacterium]
MRFLILTFIASLSLTLLSAGGPKPVFEKKGLVFEDVKEGDILTFYYHFTNEGDADFKIEHVHPTCGCTTPEWPKHPIKPGESSKIKVSFDSKDRLGYNAKGVNIHSNAGEINLVFEVYVVE